jgi:hypothetical protein
LGERFLCWKCRDEIERVNPRKAGKEIATHWTELRKLEKK